MLDGIKRFFRPEQQPVLLSYTAPTIARQMIAVAQLGNLDPRSDDQRMTAFMVATVGTRLGIDFTTDPLAPLKFLGCLEVLAAMRPPGHDSSDCQVLVLLAAAPREAA